MFFAYHFRFRAQAALALAGLLAVVCTHQTAPAQSAAKRLKTAAQPKVARDVITEQDLRKQVAGVPGMDALVAAKTKPVGDARPSMQSSLLTSSLFLFDGEMFTVVPLGAILHLPASQRHRVVAQPEGSFTFWPNFLKRNTSWLAAREVPLKMAKGDADAAKAVLQETSTDTRVVVSVYKGGPISILEPTPEAAAAAKSAAAAAKAESAEPENTPAKRGSKS